MWIAEKGLNSYLLKHVVLTWKELSLGEKQYSKYISLNKKKPEICMHRSRKFCQRGTLTTVLFSVFSWWGEGCSKCHYKRAIIGPPAKRHLNGISLVCGWWPNIECWLFQGIGTSFAKKPYIFVSFQGEGVRTPCPPLWIRPWYASYRNSMCKQHSHRHVSLSLSSLYSLSSPFYLFFPFSLLHSLSLSLCSIPSLFFPFPHLSLLSPLILSLSQSTPLRLVSLYSLLASLFSLLSLSYPFSLLPIPFSPFNFLCLPFCLFFPICLSSTFFSSLTPLPFSSLFSPLILSLSTLLFISSSFSLLSFVPSPLPSLFSPFSHLTLSLLHSLSSPFSIHSVFLSPLPSVSHLHSLSSPFLPSLTSFHFLSYHPLSLLSFVFLLSILYPLTSLFSPFSLPPFSLSSFLVSLLPSVLSLLSVFCSFLPISPLPSPSPISSLSYSVSQFFISPIPSFPYPLSLILSLSILSLLFIYLCSNICVSLLLFSPPLSAILSSFL